MNTDRTEGSAASEATPTTTTGTLPPGDAVVIVAAETVNGLGTGWPEMRQALADGRDALGEARDLAGAFRPGTVAAPCPPPDPRRCLGTPKLRKLMSDDAFLATVAGKLAVAAAGLGPGPGRAVADDRFAAFMACGIGAAGWRELVPVFRDSMDDDGRLSLARLGERGLRRCNPLFAFQVLANMPLCFLSIEESLRGDNLTFAPWEGGGVDAIAEAAASLRRGDADAAIACGASAMAGTQGVYWLAEKGLLTPPHVRPRPLGIEPPAPSPAPFPPSSPEIRVHPCWSAPLRVADSREEWEPGSFSGPPPAADGPAACSSVAYPPTTVRAPHDPPHAGLAPGDGAAALVLQRLDDARRRGARPLAALTGFARESLVTDDFAPCRDPSVVARVVRRALAACGTTPPHIAAVVLSASGDPQGDRAEAAGVAAALDAPVVAALPALALGNLFAAGPCTALAIAAHALAGDGPLAPTVRSADPIPPCPLELRDAPNAAASASLDGAVLAVFAGPGGSVGAFVLERATP